MRHTSEYAFDVSQTPLYEKIIFVAYRSKSSVFPLSSKSRTFWNYVSKKEPTKRKMDYDAPMIFRNEELCKRSYGHRVSSFETAEPQKGKFGRLFLVKFGDLEYSFYCISRTTLASDMI